MKPRFGTLFLLLWRMKRNQSPIQLKSYAFALSIVKVYQQLNVRKEFTLARQILKSGTSIGANVEEAIGAQSKKDFYMKITIAYKEARETHYWLRILQDSGYMDKTESDKMIDKVVELLKLLVSIQKSLKKAAWK